MTKEPKHITVCICTYKRPHLLKRLLETLGDQDTTGPFTYSITIADNDHLQSAGDVVSDFGLSSHIPVTYCVEPRQNIALARNKAIENATGDFVAFIDDDEAPNRQWLVKLFRALRDYDADGVLGPVRPHFEDGAPKWVIKGRFYDRPEHPTGLRLEWSQCRTGNVLLKRQLVAGDAQPFRPEFLSGEDQDFFRRMTEKGHAFIWCNEAPVYEVVPPVRWKRGFLVRRALLRGVFSQRNRRSSLLPIAKSLIAAPAYVVALPIALVMGQAKFMSYIFSLSYHIGRLLAVLGINPIRKPYVTE